ncbi:MAG: hypothetical protein WEB57_14850 [Pseudohongiellaceae bacterium]
MYSQRARAAAMMLMLCCLGAAGPALGQRADSDLVRNIGDETLRDPTRPAGAALPESSRGEIGGSRLDAGAMVNRQYRVSFIRAGGSQPMAVVNDQTVRVGEVVNGARVLTIETGVVALDVDGERRTYSTWQGESVRQSISSEAMDTDTMDNEQETDD